MKLGQWKESDKWKWVSRRNQKSQLHYIASHTPHHLTEVEALTTFFPKCKYPRTDVPPPSPRPQYNTLQRVVGECHHKNQCRIQVSPETFSDHDPCPEIRKYIEVAYKCRPGESRAPRRESTCWRDAPGGLVSWSSPKEAGFFFFFFLKHCVLIYYIRFIHVCFFPCLGSLGQRSHTAL